MPATSKHTRHPAGQTGTRFSRSTEIGLDQPETAVVPPIKQVELLSVLIEEEEKGVAQFLHLIAGLLVRHRSHLESLDLRHPVGSHLRPGCGGGLGREDCRLCPPVILELLLVVSNLPV